MQNSVSQLLKYFCYVGFVFFANTFFFSLKVVAQNETIPGCITMPYPTIINLAVQWEIQGDDNENGIVSVRFREKGKLSWEEGMALRRVPAGENETLRPLLEKNPGYPEIKWTNKHSGSIFDLKPNTTYQISLTLQDPDGGSTEETVEASTRPVPVVDKKAKIIDLGPGNYDTLKTISGTAERPVVYRCKKGTAVFKFIDIQNKQWVYVEGLTVKNPVHNGFGICLNGSSNCMISRCVIDASYGIVAYLPGATNCYISDNIITGKSVWSVETLYTDSLNQGEGIQVTGAGNVICFNRVTHFRDGISLMEDQHAANQVCNDIYNNEVSSTTDDGIEADFCFSNCRVMRNRLTNCFVGLSSQPCLGGPNYFIRNVMYNVIHASFKLQRFSQGDVVLHNTVIKLGTGLTSKSPMDYALFRNNLAIGGPSGNVNWGGWGAGNPYAADIKAPGLHSNFDYDAVGVSGTTYIAKIGDRSFSEVEPHGIERITMEEIFPGIKFPYDPVPIYTAPDLRPKAGSKVEDAALLIPNVNNNFRGKGPDCGAYETGQELPRYGPRP
ncbi:MAG TPA: right-handed parallel beta-helix repeat-containing protein [Agriterribacter sp.]|nr:right-handed parallel beta-helix repeat-containing protein [Agriterribacter sp.]